MPSMNEHKIIASWTTVAIVCGECSESWEHSHTDPALQDGAVNVCPHCLYAAHTTLRERVR